MNNFYFQRRKRRWERGRSAVCTAWCWAQLCAMWRLWERSWPILFSVSFKFCSEVPFNSHSRTLTTRRTLAQNSAGSDRRAVRAEPDDQVNVHFICAHTLHMTCVSVCLESDDNKHSPWDSTEHHVLNFPFLASIQLLQHQTDTVTVYDLRLRQRQWQETSRMIDNLNLTWGNSV